MATISLHTDPAKAGEIIINHKDPLTDKDVKYFLNKGGELFKDGSTTAIAHDAPEAIAPLETLLKHVERNADTIVKDKKLKNVLVDQIENIKKYQGIENSAGKKGFKALASANEIRSIATSATIADPDKIEKIGRINSLVPDAAKFNSAATEKAMLDAGFDWGKQTGFDSAKKKLGELLKNPTDKTKGDIEKLLIDHHGNNTDKLKLTTEQVVAYGKKFPTDPIDLAKMHKEIGKEITDGVAKAESASSRILHHTANLADATTAANLDEVKRITEELTKDKKELTELLSGKYGTKISEGLKKSEPDMYKNLAAKQKDIGALLDKAGKGTVESAAAKTGSFFMKGAEEIAKIEKPNFWNKLNGKGKAGVVLGIAGVTWAVAAAVGSKGENTDRVVERRSQGLDAPAIG